MKNVKRPEKMRTAKFTVYLYPRSRNNKENNYHNGVVYYENKKGIKKQFGKVGQLSDFLLKYQVKFEKEFMKKPGERKRLGY